MVWTANERTGAAERAAGGDGQPFGEHPYRARRIRDALGARTNHDVDGFAALQVDDLDQAALANLPALRDAFEGWSPDDPLLGQAIALLLAWDGHTDADSPAAAFYHVLVFAEWLPAIFPEAEVPGFARHWRTAYWGAEAVLQAPRSPWLADGRAKAALLRACAERACARLRALAGDRPEAWRWGALHQARFAHPLAFFPQLAAGALPPVPLGGSPFTPNQQRFASGTPPFGSALGAGVRMVTDLSRPDRLHIVLATGQSGDPRSPHFADQLPAWQHGSLAPLVLDAAAIEIESEALLEP
jgi:penicillin amidase